VIEPKGPRGLSSALHAAKAMADPVFTERVRRIRKHFLPQTALD
jgi:hypothetical protein